MDIKGFRVRVSRPKGFGAQGMKGAGILVFVHVEAFLGLKVRCGAMLGLWTRGFLLIGCPLLTVATAAPPKLAVSSCPFCCLLVYCVNTKPSSGDQIPTSVKLIIECSTALLGHVSSISCPIEYR